jgi:hypothetical protein
MFLSFHPLSLMMVSTLVVQGTQRMISRSGVMSPDDTSEKMNFAASSSKRKLLINMSNALELDSASCDWHD